MGRHRNEPWAGDEGCGGGERIPEYRARAGYPVDVGHSAPGPPALADWIGSSTAVDPEVLGSGPRRNPATLGLLRTAERRASLARWRTAEHGRRVWRCGAVPARGARTAAARRVRRDRRR